MADLTVLSDEPRSVTAEVDGATATVADADLEAALGWELKPEGLCRGDVCVPVRDRTSIGGDGRLDLPAVAEALDRPFALDPDRRVAALGEPRRARRETLGGRAAPFVLPDVDGRLHALEEWRGRKKLLVAFASW
jgi:hypothetical protein